MLGHEGNTPRLPFQTCPRADLRGNLPAWQEAELTRAVMRGTLVCEQKEGDMPESVGSAKLPMAATDETWMAGRLLDLYREWVRSGRPKRAREERGRELGGDGPARKMVPVGAQLGG